VVLLSGWLRDRASRNYFLQDQRRHLVHRLELIRVRIQSAIDGVRKDVLYLSHAPAMARLTSARGEQDQAAALQELALHFRGGLEVRPIYFEARLIGLADNGHELIRFGQTNGLIRAVPPDELQRLADQPYFQDTMRLAPGQIYLSEIKLNQESGHLTEPHRPTLRVATPIFTDSRAPFGMVMVNVDISSFFHEVLALAGPDMEVTLSNSRGDYLMHPCLSKCFGFDLGQRFSLFEEHPELGAGDRHARFAEAEDELSLTDEFPFSSDADKALILRLAMAKAPLLAPLRAQRTQNIAATLGLALLAGAIVFGVTNLFARGLRRVAEAVERYEPGKPLPDLPPDSPDEVGLLTRKFKDMAGKIAEQMQSLHEARQRAEAGVRAREEFLATISHEIRTPMNAVLGMAHLLETERNGPLQAERIRTLKFAGRHLMALLNNLLDRDRIESGDIVFDRLDFDLRDLLQNLHRSLEPLAQRKGLTFILGTSPGLPQRVEGDPVRLYQVLNNLAHNAIKFTERGKVVLRAEPGEPGEVTFQVMDTGPGLSTVVLESIRSGSAPAGVGGLGLRISRRLIELLGGSLHANGAPEASRSSLHAALSSGTILSFTLHLPTATGPTAPLAPEEPPDLKGYSALIVEDVPSNQIVLSALLGKTGLAIDVAGTAAEAREKLCAKHYDFALVDVQLPDANGAELAATLGRLQPELRLVAVTAQVSPEIRSACAAAGVREFVPKPIEPAELYEKLRRLTSPRLEAIERMFDHEPAKVAEYFAQLDCEIRNWERELRLVMESSDADRLRHLHHRMKNALGQLELWKLDQTLGALRRAIERGEEQNARELAALALHLIGLLHPFTTPERTGTPLEEAELTTV
jgi:signal transduction histidine kinase/DNA-binding response OmpR family regulator